MHTGLPDFIDPWRFADEGGILRGRIALGDMKRLAGLAQSPGGDVAVELQGGRDVRGQRFLRGTFAAAMVLECQRCMQPMELDMSVSCRLGLLASEAGMDSLPDDYEPLVTTGPVKLAELVEDELVLALPVVPRHEPADCTAAYAGRPGEAMAQGEKHRPFAALAELLKKPD